MRWGSSVNSDSQPPNHVSLGSFQERNDGRQLRSYNETDFGPHRLDDERDGAHRPRRLPLANLRRPGNRRRDCAVDVGRHLFRAAALPGYRRLLRGDGEALSRHGQFVLLCRTVVSQPRHSVAVCSTFEVHRRLGLALVLLDLSRRDGWRHGSPRGLPRRNHLAELHERLQSRTHVHDGRGHRVLVRCRLHRPPRRERLDVGQHRHQRHPDQRAAGLLGDGSGLPHESSAGQRGLSVRFRLGRRVHL